MTKYVNELEAPVLEGPVPDDVLKEIEGMALVWALVRASLYSDIVCE